MIRNRLLALTLVLFACLISGCLTSEAPFYRDSDIIWDSKILGDYRDPKTREGFLIQRDHDRAGRYMVRTFDGPRGSCSITFVGTLFRAGDKTFLDLFPVRDTGGTFDGAMPGSNDTIHRFVYQPWHLVLAVYVSEKGIGFSIPHYPDQIQAVMRSDPTLTQYFTKKGNMFRFTQTTLELHAMLEKLSASKEIFSEPEKYFHPVPSSVSGLQE